MYLSEDIRTQTHAHTLILLNRPGRMMQPTSSGSEAPMTITQAGTVPLPLLLHAIISEHVKNTEQQLMNASNLPGARN